MTTALVIASTNPIHFTHEPGQPIGRHVAHQAPGYYRPVRVESLQPLSLQPLATDERGEPLSYVTLEEAEAVMRRYLQGPGDEEPARWDTSTARWR